ncbi:HAD family hydrolase [Paeniglutamicibacter sp. ZC-3]|uniref:HAD family hydrolase n=1 Tax=Paeniglutamicibacter sp. ZC-3 TaxID=2986919 RepID=UPI0021F770E8|nr:HAD family hydrolase [Paeniglutamicibacter sp. ZC-3]MCV9994488.1 HAD family hydrolase [Paeniglutamicibacter sp. ZC-3]
MDNATSALNSIHGARSVARVEGVLFDIDDTLVDLNAAAVKGFHFLTSEDFKDVPGGLREHAARDYADDGAGAYERYMAGELTFLGQRAERIRRAYGLVGLDAPPAEALGVWSARYEDVVQGMWAPFPDVHDCLDALDALSIPYGAVSNNVEDYQRRKLELSGLGRIEVLVGSDTAGAPKPDPRPFHAGCRLLGTARGATLYVGDNPVNDVQGAIDAGLQGILLDRAPDHKTRSSEILQNLGSLAAIITGNPGFLAR